MSDSLQTAQQWCDRARALVNQRTSQQLAKALHEVADQLDRAFAASKGRPAEISAAEWDKAKTAIVTARSGRIGAAQPAPSVKANMNQKDNFEAYEAEVAPVVQALVAKAAERNNAFNALDAEDIKKRIGETGKGLAKLKQLNKPADALAEVDALKKRMTEASTNKPNDLASYMNMNQAKAYNVAFKQQIADLELSLADDTVSALEDMVADALAERKQVLALQKALVDASDKPTDLAGWRQLAANERRVEAIRKDFPKILADAQEVGRTSQQKRQQCENFEPRVNKALGDWPTYTITQKLSKRDQDEGSIPWFQDKLDRLEAEPYVLSQPGDEAKKIFAAQWKKFTDDVWKGWDEFVQSGYNKKKRGPMGDPGLRPAAVENEIGDEGKEHVIKGKKFIVAPSLTTGKSLKRQYPEPPNGYPVNVDGDIIASYVYHLKQGATATI